MPFPILGGKTIIDDAFSVANSCSFNKADVSYLHKTMGAGNRKTFTFSIWVKRVLLGVNQYFTPTQADSANANAGGGSFDVNDLLDVWDYNAPGISAQMKTNRKFRDIGAWMHVVITADTTDSTENNRFRMYINGVDERTVGGYATDVMPAEDYEFNMNQDGEEFYIGTYFTTSPGSSQYGGYMAEVCFIDGTAYAASDFGEFNEDSPTIWQPKDVSGLTFGTNGFYLDFQDSSNLGNDANGGTDLTEVALAAVDQSTDTPTLNYPILNTLQPSISNLTVSEGNLNMISGDANYRSLPTTMGATAGKWYAEYKAVSGFSGVDASVGIYRADTVFVPTTGLGNFDTGHTWSYGAAGLVRTEAATEYTASTYTDGDIIQVAMDLDNNKLYFGKENTWQNSGDPTSGATGTGAFAITAGDFFHFAVASISSGGAKLWSCNFGSPRYANSSDAADANGHGAFEFAPPSGYYAMNSKNLAEFG